MSEPTHADRLRRMADRIDHNQDSPFGGVCVIIPPPNGGQALEFLTLDANQDPTQFWATIATKIKLALEDAEAERRRLMGFGTPR